MESNRRNNDKFMNNVECSTQRFIVGNSAKNKTNRRKKLPTPKGYQIKK